MKNSLKKLLLVTTLLSALSGCQMKKLNNNLVFEVKSQEKNNPDKNYHQSYIESRDLQTLEYAKKKVKIALFFPFSGKHQELGWHLFNAASLSLFDNDQAHNVELVLVDSKDSPESTAKSFKENIVDKNIKIVIGPVFGNSIKSIAHDIEKHDITAISLSNNQSLANKTSDNSGVFLSGIFPESELDKITSHAISKEKLNFAIIAPNNKYGITITELLKVIVKSKDGNFIISELYRHNDESIKNAAQRAVKAFSIDSKYAEGKGSELTQEERDEKEKIEEINEEFRYYPQIIMIPESGITLSKIAAYIKEFNTEEREFQIVGTNQWDDIATLNDPNLLGAWFSAPKNEKFREFEKNYYETFNKFPPRISSIAYDSVAAITKLVDLKGGRTVRFKDFISYKNQKNGFEGIDGLFRYLPNGLVQRDLAILGVGDRKFEIVEEPVGEFLSY